MDICVVYFDYNCVLYGCENVVVTEEQINVAVKPVSEKPQEKIVIRRAERVNNAPVYLFIKRAFDVFCSFLGLCVAIIPMLIVGAIVKIDSKGPAIYKQERLGLNGKAFNMYKFRSMRMDAEKDGARWADKEDDRVTKVGKILRKFRIDELPQLVNVLVGDMSFVGPRPERGCFYEEFATYIDGFEQRLLVKPGVTGWAQVSGGYDLLPEEKVVYDIEYMENRGLLMDLKCLFLTVMVVLKGDGSR